MKHAILRPAARQDQRDQVRYYRVQAGPSVAMRLVRALQEAVRHIEEHPGSGSPRLGQLLGVEGLRTWAVPGFPLSLWYFERSRFVELVRIIGQRLDPATVELHRPEE